MFVVIVGDVSVWVVSITWSTSTSHSITVTSVLSLFSTQKIVHLTAAEESVVYTSNSEFVFNFVALVHILPACNHIFTNVFKLSFHLKFSLFSVIEEFTSTNETDQSEKNNSSHEGVFIITFWFQFFVTFHDVSIFIVSHSL